MIVGSGIALGGISWMMLLVSATVGNIQADQAERTLVKDKAHVSAVWRQLEGHLLEQVQGRVGATQCMAPTRSLDNGKDAC